MSGSNQTQCDNQQNDTDITDYDRQSEPTPPSARGAGEEPPHIAAMDGIFGPYPSEVTKPDLSPQTFHRPDGSHKRDETEREFRERQQSALKDVKAERLWRKKWQERKMEAFGLVFDEDTQLGGELADV